VDRFKRAALAATVSRVVVVPIAILAMAIWPVAGSAVAAPPATQVITAFPVGPNGEPRSNGYQEAPSRAPRHRQDRCCAWTTRGTSACIG
jgi:hypothetical protein